VINRLTGIPYSFTAHAHDIFVHRAMLARKLADAEFVVTISHFNRQWLQRQCAGVDKSKIHVIHCGVPVSRYRSLRTATFASSLRVQRGVSAVEREARSLPTPDETSNNDYARPLRVLSVGALLPYKGHATLIDACALLSGRLSFECRVVGGGPLAAELKAQIARHKLDGISMLGPLDEDSVRRELAWADVFVLASVQEPSGKMEGIPVALMEAMAAGLPVVASRLSGIPELVEHGQTGLLATPGDAAAFATAIWQLRDPLLRAELGANAQHRVAEQFELADSLRQLTVLFERQQVQTRAVA
jgi:glycosyltransferase involved in cell wall biosynthesis